MRATLPPEALDATDRLLINRLQDGLPLTHAPFAPVAAEAGLTEAEVVARIAQLREIGAITRFGPFHRRRGDGRGLLPVRHGRAGKAGLKRS